MVLDRLTLSHKLYGGVLGAVALALTVGGIGYYCLQDSGRHIGTLGNTHLVSVYSLGGLWL